MKKKNKNISCNALLYVIFCSGPPCVLSLLRTTRRTLMRGIFAACLHNTNTTSSSFIILANLMARLHSAQTSPSTYLRGSLCKQVLHAEPHARPSLSGPQHIRSCVPLWDKKPLSLVIASCRTLILVLYLTRNIHFAPLVSIIEPIANTPTQRETHTHARAHTHTCTCTRTHIATIAGGVFAARLEV